MAGLVYLSRGTSGHDRRWVSLLERAGHDVTVLAGAGVDACAAALDGIDGPVPDLVVAGPLTDAGVAAVRWGRAPVLGVCWAFDLMSEAADPAVAADVREALPRLAWLHVDNPWLAAEAARWGADPDRVSCSPWGIDLDAFAPRPPAPGLGAAYGWPEDATVVLSTRAHEPVYDLETVLRGFALAAGADRRLRLAVAGTGSLTADLRALAGALGIEERVAWLGRLDAEALRGWLGVAACYVTASHSDGTSLSVLEALASGVPVAAPDLPTNTAWLEAPAAALFPLGSPAGCAVALEALAGQRSDAVRAACRALAERHGDGTRNDAAFVDALDALLARPTDPEVAP